MTTVEPIRIKRRDGDVLVTFCLRDGDGVAVDLTGITTARVIIAKPGRTPIVDREGTIAADRTTGIVTITLSADDTAVAGDYQGEVETLPGPHTWPSSGYVPVSIVPDLG